MVVDLVISKTPLVVDLTVISSGIAGPEGPQGPQGLPGSGGGVELAGYAELRSFNDPSVNVVFLTDVAEAGLFIRVPSGADDSATIISAADTGFWQRQILDNNYHFKWWTDSAKTITVRMQEAIDLATTNQGKLILDPIEYLLETTGADPYYLFGVNTMLYCLELKTNTRIDLNGATLKLADNQIIGDVRVNIFTAQDVSDVKIKNGIIDGNEANQTQPGGYFGQTHFGSGIWINSTSPTGQTNFNVEIDNLTVQNHSSNSINAFGVDNIYVQGHIVNNCGEGCQLIRCANVKFSNYKCTGTANTDGDGLEFSQCTDVYFNNILAIGLPSGTAIDLFGSSNVIGSGVIAKNCNSGISAESTATPGQDAFNIILSNIYLENNLSFGIDCTNGNMQVNNARIVGGNDGIRALNTFSEDGAADRNTFYGVQVVGCSDGIDMQDPTNATFYNCQIINSVNYGIRVKKAGTGSLPEVEIFNSQFINSGLVDIRIDQAGDVAFLPNIKLIDTEFDVIQHSNVLGDGNVKFIGRSSDILKTNMEFNFAPPFNVIDRGVGGSKFVVDVDTSSAYEAQIEATNDGFDIKTNSTARFTRIGNLNQVRTHPTLPRTGLNINPLFLLDMQAFAAGNVINMRNISGQAVWEVFINSGGNAGAQLRNSSGTVRVFLSAYSQNYITDNLKLGAVGAGELHQLFIDGEIGFVGKNTDGSQVENESLFKGTDGELYWKNTAGVVTQIS